MTAPDFAPLAAALHTRQDLTAAVIAVLATRAVSDGLSAYEVLDAVRYAADEIDADEATIDRILAAGYAAGLLTRYQHRGLSQYSLPSLRRFAIARHHGGALGWLREQCAAAPDTAAPRSLTPDEQRERQIAAVKARLPEAMRYGRTDEVAALRAEVATLRGEAAVEQQATDGSECAAVEE